LVSRLERLASRWHLSEAMLGLLVALAADAPEISSAVTASVRGQHAIGAGVVLGSNVFNLAALLGLGAIVARRIELHRRVVVFEGVPALWIAVVSATVVSVGAGAGIGLALVLLVVAPYLVVSAVPVPRLRALGLAQRPATWLARAVHEEELELSPAIHPAARGRFDGTVATGSLLCVVAASALMERSASVLGAHFGMSSLVVGGVVLAAVTSLPNAVGAVYLATRQRGTAVLSEAMNSNMLNVVVGLLLPAVFIGLGGSSGGGALAAWFYVGMTAVSLTMAFAGRGLSRAGGWAIVCGYVAFLVVATTR
jgi:cation:H+ antiporter